MELSYELTPEDYPAVRRLVRGFPWAELMAAGIVAPALLLLYLGGFRVALAVVAVVLALLLMASFRTAAAVRRKRFELHRCAPVTVRAEPAHLEIDGVIEWRRLDWAYVEDVRLDRSGWTVVSLFEGEPLLIPPRAFEGDEGQAEFLQRTEECRQSAAAPQEAELAEPLDLGEPVATADYEIDNRYMRQLVELRFTGPAGWGRLLAVAAATALGAQVWPDSARLIVAAGAAIAVPMALLRVMEQAIKRRALQRAELDFPISMTLNLYEDGYERRCRLFQSFTSWLLVDRVHLIPGFLLISGSDQEHLLIPRTAWPEGQESKFCETGNHLRDQRHKEDQQSPDDE